MNSLLKKAEEKAHILEALKNKRFQKEVLKIAEFLEFEKSTRSTDGPLSGKSFLVTGTLPVKRDEAHEVIEKNGGKLLSGVSSKLNFLIVGDDPGSKVEKAHSLDVKIISWNELLKMLCVVKCTPFHIPQENPGIWNGVHFQFSHFHFSFPVK